MSQNCYHKIEYLTYSQKCNQCAATCSQKCQTLTHTDKHQYIGLCSLQEQLKLYSNKNSVDTEYYRNKVNQIFNKSITELEQKRKQFLNKIEKQSKKVEHPEFIQAKTKISNMRYQLLKCIDVYYVIEQINSVDNIQKKLNKILDDLHKYLQSNPKTYKGKIKVRKQQLEKQIDDLRSTNSLLCTYITANPQQAQKQSFQLFKIQQEKKLLMEKNQQLIYKNNSLRVELITLRQKQNSKSRQDQANKDLKKSQSNQSIPLQENQH